MSDLSVEQRIKTIDEIVDISATLRNEGKRVVTTNGTFDIIHCAHVALLEQARAQGDCLVVLINSDDSVKRNKDPKRPIISEHQRALMIAGLRSVDYALVFSQDTPLEYLERIRPAVHVKGGSWIPGRVSEERDLVESWGGKCVYLPLEQGISTTDLIKVIVEKYGTN